MYFRDDPSSCYRQVWKYISDPDFSDPDFPPPIFRQLHL